MSQARFSRAPFRHLPAQPNLEQLKKQAKELLEEYRSGSANAVEEINRHELHAAPKSFALSDAQRVLARSYGFASWSRLKAFVDGANVERFHAAVQSGDLAQVRTMLASRPELVAMDHSKNDEHRALHYAVLRHDVAMTRMLMEAGADARKGIFPHRDATSALTLAQERGYLEVVAVIEEEEKLRQERLSGQNSSVSPVQDQLSAAILQDDDSEAKRLLSEDLSLLHASDRQGRSPLHLTSRRGNVALTSWLLERRANPNKKDSSELTPADHAALGVSPRNNRIESFPAIAKLLLSYGAEITVRVAVALGVEERVRELISADPRLLRDISDSGGLLTLAVHHRQSHMVEVLLGLGTDVDERILLRELEEPKESWGMPLWWAALAGNYEMCKLLLDRGADPNGNVYASGWPLRNAWNHPDPSVKKLLLERGAKVKPYMAAELHDVEAARAQLRESPEEELATELLVAAADYGCAEIVTMALPHLQWAKDDQRWHWILIQPIRGAGAVSAKNQGQFRCLELLLESGISPNVTRFGQTPLHYLAARQSSLSGADRVRFAALLLKAGARLDARDELLKSTPLGWSCRWGHRELVEFLLSQRADAQEAEAEPWATPSAWAKKKGYSEILVLLHNEMKIAKD